ncbi:class I SAM-dependent methyltransferase [Sphingomonas arenae]|uniref:class I SAM-dependent methyltransferase n=1 Tax=Sphingomonas arenae TaxID=2812555 RepID=UPI0019677CAB|nr:class I SAM-dependent methyltransferase [Sphingomonas arenae]
MTGARNIDARTVEGFGREWSAFDQRALTGGEYAELFDRYFHLFPWERLPADAEGFDLGCGSGRWADGVARRVGLLHCVDPSAEALAVARERLGGRGNVRFHEAAADTIPVSDGSQDFGYSLGVLHHVPDTGRALADCVRKLKPDAPFLLYLYYALDGRPGWFRGLWKASDWLRRGVHRLPFPLRKAATTALAAGVYWPLARGARAAERLGRDVSGLPLSSYRHTSFYTMRTDALDRFGTRLEQRFSRDQIAAMMAAAGLTDIRFSEREPYWVALGYRAAP